MPFSQPSSNPVEQEAGSQLSASVAPAGPNELHRLAQAIDRAGLAVPAVLILHIARPLSWIGGQLLWTLQPLLEGFGFGSRRSAFSVAGLARLLEGEGNIDSLIDDLDTRHKRDK